jgi:GH15 family glucan-1,4-alpha-glucosidase
VRRVQAERASPESVPQRLEELGLLGNCQFSALVDRRGEVQWCCLPRFDSEPVFARLLDHEHGGGFRVGPADGASGTQRYLENTNILETTFRGPEGAFRVLDFAPRFLQHERVFRPTMLLRRIEPLEGSPRVSVTCAPVLGWSRRAPERLEGSNHVDFAGYARPLRLTTDVPLAYLGGQPFVLTERRHLALSYGPPVEESLAPMFEHFLAETARYWRRWVKHCNIPPLYQDAVIRSALVLKLHCFEDTGAIVAAMTTSLPEAPGSGRTWDYRYCWLRDSYYVLGALRLLGHFEERERFVQFLLDVAGGTPGLALRPLYRVDGRCDLSETLLPAWKGHEGSGPVRVGNQAAEHVQNDVFGELVLALAPVFLDQRFRAEQTQGVLDLLVRLARKGIAAAGTPDAGIWEYRTAWVPQTFSSLMGWAAADRMRAVARLHAPDIEGEFAGAAERIHAEVLAKAWSAERGAFAGSYGGRELDASLLQMVPLRFLSRDDPRLASTVDAIGRGLELDGWIQRYQHDDGFGRPQVAFVLCTLWYVEALATLGRIGEAEKVLTRVQSALSPLGLLAEDFDPRARRQWGNFPQAYSHVGLIHAAFATSPRWAEVV